MTSCRGNRERQAARKVSREWADEVTDSCASLRFCAITSAATLSSSTCSAAGSVAKPVRYASKSQIR